MPADVNCSAFDTMITQSKAPTSNMSVLDLLVNVTSECNVSSRVYREMPIMPLYITVTSTLLYVIIFLAGIVGNSVVVAVVCLHRDMRSSTNLFLVNLALADLMLITVCMPPALADIYANDVWHFGAAMCTMVPLLENCSAHASVLTMLLIAGERFQAICHPLKIRDTRLYSKTVKLIIILVIWFISLMCSMPLVGISVYRGSHYDDGTPIKVCRQSIRLPWQYAYIMGLFAVFFVLPFVTLALVYMIIARVLVKDFQYNNITEDQRCRTKNKARKKVVMMLVLITALFFIFHLPFRTLSIWMTYAHPSKVRALGFEGYWNLLCFARIMFYLNSCVNPIVYNIISTKFRCAFLRVFCCRRKVIVRENTQCTNGKTAGTHVSLKLIHKYKH